MNRAARHVILIDFGSTYTKLAVVDRQEHVLVHTGNYPSTVATDARIGLEQCFNAARAAIGDLAFEKALKLSSSSAAGGLRMGVIGLTKSLSIAVGRNAAFGAGAKILATCVGHLTAEDLGHLSSQPLEILLFCGGYDQGNTSVIEHNAQMLANSHIHIPIIYSGNSDAAPVVRRLFSIAGKEFYVTPNIIPNVGELNKEQVESLIREIFLKRIINMKRLDKVSAQLDKMVMPTPAAVLSAGELLSTGTGEHKGLGPLMIIDVGGATTDIHSYVDQIPYLGAKLIGAQESYTKRTVEGDLGMRESSNSLSFEIGLDKMQQQTGLTQEELAKTLSNWQINRETVPKTKAEKAIDLALVSGAVYIASRRHAGRISRVSAAGIRQVQLGKNLTVAKTVIGTGGPLIFSIDPVQALRGTLRNRKKEADILLPEEAQYFLDEHYVFFAAGLLREVDEEAAFLLMTNSLRKI